MHAVIGIDPHKHVLSAMALDARGGRLGQWAGGTTRQAIRAVQAWAAQLAQQDLGLIEQASVMVHHLVAGAQHHGERLAGWFRPAGSGGLEGVRQVGMRQELAGDRLGIHGVALAATRPPAPPLRGAGGADVPHVGASVHEGQGQAPAQEVAAFDRPDGLGGDLRRPRLDRADRLG